MTIKFIREINYDAGKLNEKFKRVEEELERLYDILKLCKEEIDKLKSQGGGI